MIDKNNYLANALLFKLLGNPNRLKILVSLLGGEMCVEELQQQVNCRQCNISQHLILLKQNQIVFSTRKGKRVYYNINSKIAKLLCNH